MIKKGEVKKSNGLMPTKNNNVKIGPECGFSGVAQIGKGMWAMPDKMSDMFHQKISHLMAELCLSSISNCCSGTCLTLS